MRVAGESVRYREAGLGPPVVLVHGLGLSADSWFRNGAVLAAGGYRVLAPDLPGFGRSGGSGAATSVGEQSAFLTRWSQALDLPAAVYVGHSLACQTVLHFAATHPDRVRALVLAAPSGDGGMTRRLTRQAIGFFGNLPKESLALAMIVAQAYLMAGPVRVLRTWVLGARHDPRPLLPRVRAPTLVIHGERDPIVDLAFARSLAESLPDGEVVIVPRMAHAVLFDRSGQFNEAVLRFLGKVHREG